MNSGFMMIIYSNSQVITRLITLQLRDKDLLYICHIMTLTFKKELKPKHLENDCLYTSEKSYGEYGPTTLTGDAWKDIANKFNASSFHL